MNTTATKEEVRPALVPKLRFPEFRGAEGWKSGQLEGALSSISSGLVLEQGSDTSGYRVTRIETISAGTIDLEKVGLVKTSQDISAYKLRVGDILFSNINSVAHIGKSVFVDRDYDIYHGMNLLRLGANRTKHNPQFIFFLINTDEIRASLRERANKAVNQASINQTELGKTEVALPQKPEQQKIAECLSSVDELIAEQARKLSALKTHKKGLMQQLFPREGETQPRLRFPEFQNPWKASVIDQLASTVMGNAFKSTDFVESGTQVIRIGNLYQSELQLNRSPVYLSDLQAKENSRFIVKSLDLLMSMTGTVGKRDYGFVIQVPAGCKPLLLNQRVMKIAPKPDCNVGFLLQLLKNEHLLDQLYSQPGGTKQANLSAQDVKELKISFPHESEQQRIASCLTSLDNLIAAQTQKHEALKTHKKGLMQQLFPSPEVVEA